MNDEIIRSVVTEIWVVINGHLNFFTNAAVSILGFLLAIELINEALNIATGRGFQLDRKIMTWVVIAAIITGYPAIAGGIWKSAVLAGENMFSSYIKLAEKNIDANQKLEEIRNANRPKGGILKIFATLINSIFLFLVAPFAGIFILISFMIIAIFVIGAYVCLALCLAVGPIFIIFFMSPLFRGIAVKWVSNVLSYLVMIPMLGIVIEICAHIVTKPIMSVSELHTEPGAHLMALFLFGPILSVGIVLHVPKLIKGLLNTGGAGAEGLGAVSQTAKIAGGVVKASVAGPASVSSSAGRVNATKG